MFNSIDQVRAELVRTVAGLCAATLESLKAHADLATGCEGGSTAGPA